MTDREPFSFGNQKRKTDINDMPSLEPTAEVPAIHSDKLNSSDYWNDKLKGETAIVPPEHRDDRHEVSGRGWKRPVVAGTAILAALAGGIGFGMYAMGGNDTKTEPRAEPSVSAPVTPEQTPVLPGANDIEMLDSRGTADEVQGNFRALLSSVINERADQGGIISDNSDLQYISSGPNLGEFDQFVKDQTNDLIAARKYSESKGYTKEVKLGIMTKILSSEPTQTGGYVVTASTEYEALDADNNLVGAISGNLDTYIYSYEFVTFTLPDGTQKETFALVGFEKVLELPE